VFFTFVALLAMIAGSPAKGLSPGGGATRLADENLSLCPPIRPLAPKNEDDLFPLPPPNREKCCLCCAAASIPMWQS